MKSRKKQTAAIAKSESTAIGGAWTWATVANDAMIVARLACGLDITNTCKFLGVDKKSFYDRMKRDEAFASKVNRSRAEAESNYWQRLRDIAEDPEVEASVKLKAIMRVLEVMNPRRYGAQAQLEVTGEVQQQVQWVLPHNTRVPITAEVVRSDDDE